MNIAVKAKLGLNEKTVQNITLGKGYAITAIAKGGDAL